VKKLLGDSSGRVFALAGLAIGLAFAFFAIRILIVPLVAAVFVAYLFDPPIVAMQRRGVGRGPAFLLLLTLSLTAIAVILVLMPSWLRSESIVATNQTFIERFTIQLNAVEHWVKARLPMLASISMAKEVTARAGATATHFFEQLPGLISTFLVDLLLVPFIAYFMVRDGKTLKRRIVEIVPNRYFEMSLIMFNRIEQQIGGYFRGRLIECILVGVAQAVCMSVASIFVPQGYILLIAGVCGVTSIIPYVGPIMGTMFGAVLYLGSDLPATAFYGLMTAAAVTHLVDNLVIAPAVLSHNVDLHPLTVALVLVVGGELLGTLGLLIAVPVASTIKVVAQEFYANYQLQVHT